MILIDIVKNILLALVFFLKKRVTIFAAASAFYLLLSLVPMCLLLLKVSSYFFSNWVQTKQHLMEMMNKLFPEFGQIVLNKFDQFISNLIFTNPAVTFLNLVILLFVSLAFVNSIWQGLALITGEKHFGSLFRHLKGAVIILVGIMLITLSQIVPTYFIMFFGIIKSNLSLLSSDFSWMESNMIRFLQSDLINSLVFIVYFTFLYRWFFAQKGNLFVSLIGALVFIACILVGKSIYWSYFQHVQSNIVLTYGDFYLFVVSLIWIYLIMCFFFFGACVCYIFINDKKVTPKFDFMEWQ